jgi:hypothetical protein
MDNSFSKEPGVSAIIGVTDSPVVTILNGLLGAVWRAYAQHQTHVALIGAKGLQGLAEAMRIHTADEPGDCQKFCVLSRLIND